MLIHSLTPAHLDTCLDCRRRWDREHAGMSRRRFSIMAVGALFAAKLELALPALPVAPKKRVLVMAGEAQYLLLTDPHCPHALLRLYPSAVYDVVILKAKGPIAGQEIAVIEFGELRELGIDKTIRRFKL